MSIIHPSNEARNLSRTIKAVTYTPGKSDDTAMVNRLAVQVQAADAADGIERSWEACVRRARQNLTFVRELAGAKGAQS